MASKKKYFSCCNPFELENHNVTKGLRLATKSMQEKHSLLRSDYLCSNCRKMFYATYKQTDNATNDERQMNSEDENDIVEGASHDVNVDDDDDENQVLSGSRRTDSQPISSEEIPSQPSSSSEMSIASQLPVINDSLRVLNQSPILSYKLSNETYLRKKVDDTSSYLSASLGLEQDSRNQSNSEDFLVMIKTLKSKYHDKNTTNSERIQILTLLLPHWTIYKICKVMDSTKYLAGAAQSLREKKGILSLRESKPGRCLSEHIRLKVSEFYIDDETSIMMPGMKDFVSVRDENGARKHIQKKLILSNLEELYELFKMRYPDYKIGFSMFASLRPKQCVLAGSGGTHTVCVCSIHQNIKLMMLGCNLATLTTNVAISLKDYRDCCAIVICKNPSPECYYGECSNCPGIDKLKDLLSSIFDYNFIDDVTYKHWVANPRTSLETLTKNSFEFVEDFCSKILGLLPHAFIAKEQAKFLRCKKESLNIDEFIVILDFAENYAFVIQDAAPGFHWNNNQATIFPVVIYFKTEHELCHRSIAIISECTSHDADAVNVFIRIVMDFIKTLSERPKKIFYFSDGAPQQFKNMKNFVNLYHHREDFSVDTEWHFFATAHGKGPCDGIGGTIKRLASRASLQLPFDRQITTPQELYEWASQPSNLPNIEITYSTQNDYERRKTSLQPRYTRAQPVMGTQKLHCVIPNKTESLTVKRFSSSVGEELHKLFKRQKK